MNGLAANALPIGLVAIGLLTLVAALLTKGKVASRPLVCVVYGITAALGYGYFVQRKHDTDRTAYNVCVSKVLRSDGNRAQWLALAHRFDEVTGTVKYGDLIRADLEANLPALDIKDCHTS